MARSLIIPAADREVLDQIHQLLGIHMMPMKIEGRWLAEWPEEHGVPVAGRWKIHYPGGLIVVAEVEGYTSGYGDHRKVISVRVRLRPWGEGYVVSTEDKVREQLAHWFPSLPAKTPWTLEGEGRQKKICFSLSLNKPEPSEAATPRPSGSY